MNEKALVQTLNINFLPRSIQETQDGTLCICVYKSGTLYCFSKEGNMSTVNFEYPLSDISIHRDSDQIYGVSTGDKTVRELSRARGTVTPIFDTEETAHCLCVTKSGQFVVSDTSKALVSIYDRHGERLHRMQCDTSPNHIAECFHSNKIALACYGSGVVVTDKKLWKLVTDTNSKEPKMDAWDVAFDSAGALYVADEFNKKVHILDAGTGQERDLIRHSEMGLVRCIIVRANGDLVVGTDNPCRILTFRLKN